MLNQTQLPAKPAPWSMGSRTRWSTASAITWKIPEHCPPVSRSEIFGGFDLSGFPEGMELIVTNLKRHKGWRCAHGPRIFPGERITLVRKLNTHAVVIKVKGCDIALSSEVAEFILVEPSG